MANIVLGACQRLEPQYLTVMITFSQATCYTESSIRGRKSEQAMRVVNGLKKLEGGWTSYLESFSFCGKVP